MSFLLKDIILTDINTRINLSGFKAKSKFFCFAMQIKINPVTVL